MRVCRQLQPARGSRERFLVRVDVPCAAGSTKVIAGCAPRLVPAVEVARQLACQLVEHAGIELLHGAGGSPVATLQRGRGDAGADRFLHKMVGERVIVALATPGFAHELAVDQLVQPIQQLGFTPAAHFTHQVDIEGHADHRRYLGKREGMCRQALQAPGDGGAHTAGTGRVVRSRLLLDVRSG